MNSCSIYLNRGEDERIRRGHVWVYNNEISRIEGRIESGNLGDVYSQDGCYLGQGFVNSASKIFVRIISRDQDVKIDDAYFEKKLLAARKRREDMGMKDTYRACFGEADGIPGLIVDKYSDYLVVQFLSLGVEKRAKAITESLVRIYKPKGIYERSDVPAREKEGLEQRTGLLYGDVPDRVEIKEGGLGLLVDLKNGQKTGSYLDQRENHLAITSFVKGKRVLDCFSHDGNFGLQAKLAGAREVICVDISKDACQRIAENAMHNGLVVDTIEANVFNYLDDAVAHKEKFDVVILDPPAFAKKRSHLEKAEKGYYDINMKALELVKDDGYLVTSSCSHYLSLEKMLEILGDAARKCEKTLHMVKFSLQRGDHPVLIGSDETLYLKFLILRVNGFREGI